MQSTFQKRKGQYGCAEVQWFQIVELHPGKEKFKPVLNE